MKWCARVEKNESRIFPKQSGAHTFITMGTCTLYAQLLPMHASIHKAKGNFGRVKKHLAFLYWIESNRICDRSNEIKLNLKFWSVVCLLTHLAHRIYVSNSCNAIISTLTSNNILQPFIEWSIHTTHFSIFSNLNKFKRRMIYGNRLPNLQHARLPKPIVLLLHVVKIYIYK